jgi:hypothetical protein
VLSRTAFVKKVFWESVRAGALIVGFNLPFDIARIATRWTAARNGGFSFVLSQLSKKQVENQHRPRIRIAPLNGVAEQIELTAVRRKDEHQFCPSKMNLTNYYSDLRHQRRSNSGVTGHSEHKIYLCGM